VPCTGRAGRGAIDEEKGIGIKAWLQMKGFGPGYMGDISNPRHVCRRSGDEELEAVARDETTTRRHRCRWGADEVGSGSGTNARADAAETVDCDGA